MRTTTCRSCDAPGFWAMFQTSKKRVLVDLEPRHDGDVVVVGEEEDEQFRPTPVVRKLRRGESCDGERYSVHFSTCPHSASWRKKEAPKVAVAPGGPVCGAWACPKCGAKVTTVPRSDAPGCADCLMERDEIVKLVPVERGDA